MLRSPNYKWWAYTAIAIGMFLAVMDQTALNIALPRIAEHFSADLPTVQWVALGYALSTTVVLLPMGRLSDIVGRKRVYLLCSVIFIVAAALGGFSGTLSMVIAVKIVQGIGSGGIQANGLGMVLEVFPERERGKAAGLYMAVVGTGAVSGPVVGGLLVSGLGWRGYLYGLESLEVCTPAAPTLFHSPVVVILVGGVCG